MPKTLTYDPEGLSLTITTGTPVISAQANEIEIPFTVAANGISQSLQGRVSVSEDTADTLDSLDKLIQQKMQDFCEQAAQRFRLLQSLEGLGY